MKTPPGYGLVLGMWSCAGGDGKGLLMDNNGTWTRTMIVCALYRISWIKGSSLQYSPSSEGMNDYVTLHSREGALASEPVRQYELCMVLVRG